MDTVSDLITTLSFVCAFPAARRSRSKNREARPFLSFFVTVTRMVNAVGDFTPEELIA